MRVGRGLRAIEEAESTDGRGGDVARELAVVVVLSGGDERRMCGGGVIVQNGRTQRGGVE